ncbi:MAG: hypothetical protein ACI9BW_001943 [Gammaproteobacteria bacterium]|jgi:hypothetical protein
MSIKSPPGVEQIGGADWQYLQVVEFYAGRRRLCAMQRLGPRILS